MELDPTKTACLELPGLIYDLRNSDRIKGREIDDVLINLTVLGRRGTLRPASYVFNF